MIRLQKVKRKVYSHGEYSDKYVVKMILEETLSIDKIEKRIVEASSVSTGEVKFVLEQLEKEIEYSLSNGYAVKLGALGTLYPTVRASAQDTADKANTSTVKNVYCTFKPSKQLKEKLSSTSLQMYSDEVRDAIQHDKKII